MINKIFIKILFSLDRLIEKFQISLQSGRIRLVERAWDLKEKEEKRPNNRPSLLSTKPSSFF